MFGHSNDGHISPPTTAIKACSPGCVSVISCDDINHLNEHTIIVIKFGAIMPKKSDVALIYAIFHNVAAHCSLFLLQGIAPYKHKALSSAAPAHHSKYAQCSYGNDHQYRCQQWEQHHLGGGSLLRLWWLL